MSYNKTINPLSKKKDKTGSKKIGKSKDFDDFIAPDSEDIDEISEQAKPKMKRLKKLRNSSDEQEELVRGDKEEDDDEWNAGSNDERQNDEDFKKFQYADDEDLKRKEKQEEEKKKKKKMKGNQEINKFMGGPKKGTENKAKKAETQMSLTSMFQKSSQPKKRKDSFQQQMANIQLSGNESSSQDEQELNKKRLLAYQDYNAGRNQDQAMAQALKKSLAQNKQEDQYKSIQNYQFSFFNKKMDEKDNEREKKNKDIQKAQTAPNNIKKNEQKSKGKKESRKRSRSAPKKKQKESSKGGLLAGLTIVMTGQFVPYSKGHLSELFVELGADCPKTLTKKVTHLLQGAFVADQYGRKLDQDVKQTSKSRQAESRGIKIIPFEGLDDFFIEKTGKTLQQLMEKDQVNEKKDTFVEIQKTGTKMDQQNQSDAVLIQERKILQKKNQNIQPNQMIDENLQKYSFSVPWTEKHKPLELKDIIGQNSQIKNLRQWLQSWQDIHIRGNKRDVKPSFNTFMPSGTINSKAALLSGDAGLGKTTTARLLAAQYGYGVVEFNASDVRNKKSIELIGANKDNMWLSQAKTIEKTLLIMDEVDGMSSGDRGGITAIIDMIKKTKIPIICICNDRQSTKIRSLAGHCYDIKFHKPDQRMIIKRLAQIITKQGGTSTEKGLQRIVTLLQNDVRQILTYLQIFFRTVSRNVTYDAVFKNCNQAKDNSIMMNHFEASKKLMNKISTSSMTISQKIDLTFVDSDMVPLMVQENYLSACQKGKMNKKSFHKLVKATEGFVTSDLIDKKIMKNQHFCLMPNKMFTGCVYPAQMTCENLGFPKFTNWLGKFSSERKVRRISKEIKNSLCPVTNVSSNETAKRHYATMLFEWIYQHLKVKDPDIDSIVLFMDHYNFTPASLTESITCLQYGNRESLLKDIPAATKAKLTRAYNKHHETTKFKKNKVKVEGQKAAKYDPVLGEMLDEKLDEEQEEDKNDEEEEIIVGKKSQAVKGKKKK